MSKLKEIFVYLIGVIVVTGALGSTVLLQYHAVPDDNRDVLNQANGSLWTMAIMVVTWCFGSSKGSERKDDMLLNSTPTQSKPPLSNQPEKPEEKPA